VSEKNVAPPTAEEAVTGPKTPLGFSGIRPWVMGIRIVPIAILVGGAGWYLSHPLSVNSSASAGTIQGKVAAVDPGDLVARPVESPTARPKPAAQLVAKSDLGPSMSQTATPLPQPPPAPVYAAATIAPTLSPTQLAEQKRAEDDRAALDAPLPLSSPMTVAAAPTKAADYDVAPPSDIFLAPGTEIDVTLETSIDSTVQTGETGTIIGFTGNRPVLDYYKRVTVIPALSKIVGHMASTTLQPGQSRIGVIWNAIQLPNGHSILLDNAPGIDLTGTTGFGAAIDNHTRKEIVNVIAFSLLAAGAQLAQPQAANACGSGNYGCAPSVGQSIGQAFGTQVSTLAANAYNRSSQVQPTAHVIEGAQVGVMVTGYLPMRAWDPNAP
jgi:type IV secretory pathway VirB10-like protein